MTAWSVIVENFRHLMQETIKNDAINLFDETPSGPDITKLPNSKFNGSYSISYRGNPQVFTEINGTITLQYGVRLKVCFVINQEDKNDPDTSIIDKSKREYHNAVSDIETIVVKRLTASTFQDELDNIELQNIGELTFLDDIQNYATCDLDFSVRATREL